MIKKLSIIAGALIVVGLIGGIATFSSEMEDDSFSTKISDAQFDTVTVEADNLDIVAMQGDSDPTIEITGNNAQKISEQLKIDQKDGHLSIISDVKVRKLFSFGFNQSAKIKLLLPEQMYQKVELLSKSGDIYIEEVEGVDIIGATTHGDIVASTSTSTHFNAKTTNGSINLKQIAGEITSTSKNGDITIKNDVIAAPLFIKTKNGDIVIHANAYPDDVQFDTATKFGDIMIFGDHRQLINNQDPGTLLKLATRNGDIIVSK